MIGSLSLIKSHANMVPNLLRPQTGTWLLNQFRALEILPSKNNGCSLICYFYFGEGCFIQTEQFYLKHHSLHLFSSRPQYWSNCLVPRIKHEKPLILTFFILKEFRVLQGWISYISLSWMSMKSKEYENCLWRRIPSRSLFGFICFFVCFIVDC